ncbi:hypothetical protein CP10139811_0769 [Chlamydia ibidis]|uniref:Uncharacterized protein n=2 Tax=Chlamydia ibidis TaxID=1405396 RepID=S7J263_9CHLA|nr:hypothetical protein [Chlamydia ibidis]EPP34514.1 hypothetical protein CP10139811_0769 [Chlamydia ibidis]EQM63102.1 hypothetical protein H359_0089 [Chlamydia ibidis 10-1398/6]
MISYFLVLPLSQQDIQRFTSSPNRWISLVNKPLYLSLFKIKASYYLGKQLLDFPLAFEVWEKIVLNTKSLLIHTFHCSATDNLLVLPTTKYELVTINDILLERLPI